MDLPVLAEFSYDGLITASCLYAAPGPSSPEHAGNLVVVGHDYKRHFSTMKRLEAGQIVILLDKSGAEYKYKVCELVTIAPTKWRHWRNMKATGHSARTRKKSPAGRRQPVL